MDLLTECPTCDVTGVDVYRADAHPTSCTWMMKNENRCNEHDELLRPAPAPRPTSTKRPPTRTTGWASAKGH